jgi:hypothetical protein
LIIRKRRKPKYYWIHGRPLMKTLRKPSILPPKLVSDYGTQLDKVLEKFSMPTMDELNQTVPNKLQIVEVEHSRDNNKKAIE